MSEYLTSSMGPGSIGALVSGAALQHAPTIGANAPIRDVKASAHGARPVPSLGGCGDCMGLDDPTPGTSNRAHRGVQARRRSMGTAENGNGVENGNGGTNFLGLMLVPIAIVAGLWYLGKKNS